MRTVTSFLVGVGLSLCLAAAPAAGTDDARAAFDAGRQAFEQEDYRRALRHFEAALAAGLDGPAIHYNLGVTHYRLEAYTEAAAAFELIAERYPAMRALAQYNLGLVARRQGRDIEAERFFSQALANSDDETLRELARRQLSPARPPSETPRATWFSMIDTRLGHDDNVLLRAEDIPLPEGQSASSGFTEVFALASGPLASSAFRFDGSFYGARYPDASFYDQNIVQAGVAYQWNWGAWRAEAGPHFIYSTLDGDALERRFGVATRFRRPLGEATTLGIRYVRDEIDHGATRFAYLEGSRDFLELRVDHRRGSGRVSAAYAFEHNDRADPGVAPNRNRLALRYRHAVSSSWLTDLGLIWRRSHYGDMTEPRTERLTELSTTLTRLLRRGWQVNGTFSFADNDSSEPVLSYDRQRLSVGITKQF